MSRVAVPSPEPAQVQRRRYMSDAEKVARWEELGRVCTRCGLPCEPLGPTVIWDHWKSLWMLGGNELTNMEPNHAAGCAPAKTRIDAKVRAKVKRILKIEAQGRKPSRMRSRGFDKSRRKRMDGTVEIKT